MKRAFIILTAIYLVINACSDSKNTNSNTSQYPAIDTVKIAAVDTIIFQIDRQWKEDSPTFNKLGLNEHDTIKYMVLDGEAQRISSIFRTDTTLTWVTFHQKNNELFLTRFREYNSARQTSREAICYFENGELFYSKERTRILQEGDQIGSFREETFKENFRTPEKLMAEYIPYWDISKKAIEKDLQSRK
ncbi:MAG: hypothetical protein IPM82_11275 [Saprospiraceae bacterium]|nr:hypothetical protein [Saprospiraceae bacterium]